MSERLKTVEAIRDRIKQLGLPIRICVGSKDPECFEVFKDRNVDISARLALQSATSRGLNSVRVERNS